jgi:RecA-family ATPase
MTPEELKELKRKLEEQAAQRRAEKRDETDPAKPTIVSWSDFSAIDYPSEHEIIRGAFTNGSIGVLGAPSKGRKSFSIMDLTVSANAGLPWLGLATVSSKVLYCNLELKAPRCQARFNKIIEGKKLALEQRKALDFAVINLRDFNLDMTGLAELICENVEKGQFDLVIIDPIYKLYGDRDENRATDMNDLMLVVQQIVTAVGASVIMTCHFPKGNMQLRENAMDRISGSGVFGRAPDLIATLTPVKPKGDKERREYDHFQFDCTVRDFAPVEPKIIYWDHPLMQIAEESVEDFISDAEADYNRMVELIPDGGLTLTKWKEITDEELGFGKNKFYDLRDQAVEAGLVIDPKRNGGKWKRADDESDTPQNGAQVVDMSCNGEQLKQVKQFLQSRGKKV